MIYFWHLLRERETERERERGRGRERKRESEREKEIYIEDEKTRASLFAKHPGHRSDNVLILYRPRCQDILKTRRSKS